MGSTKFLNQNQTKYNLKCDPIEKIAFEPFPSWKADWPRTDMAPSLDKWKERRPTLNTKMSKLESRVFNAVTKAVNLEKKAHLIKDFELKHNVWIPEHNYRYM